MALDIAALAAVVETKGVAKAQRELRGFDKTGRSAGATFKRLSAILVGLGGALALKKIGGFVFDTTREFERLNAVLKTFTGSQKAANAAFAQLEDFTKNTPFQIEENVKAYTRLMSLGLSPTVDLMTDIGNVAAGTGASLIQFTEAVADAAVGEFERLKEFGIKASSQGDQVALTFKGITQTVEKTAPSITQALQTISRENFAGAMAEQMNTLNGIISNVQDSLTTLARALGQVLLPAIKELAGKLQQILADITTVLSRGGAADIQRLFEILGDIAAQSFVKAFTEGLSRIMEIRVLGIPLMRDFLGMKARSRDASLIIQQNLLDLQDLAERVGRTLRTAATGGGGGGGGGGTPGRTLVPGQVPGFQRGLGPTAFGLMQSDFTPLLADWRTQAMDFARQATLAMQDAAANLQTGISQTLADAVFNGMSAGLSGEGLGGIFKAFGSTLLAGLGAAVTEFGKALIAFGITTSKLAIGLSNPFTAGPSAIAIGAALVALGATFSKIASGGGPGRGTAGAGAFREPSFAPVAPPADVATRTISLGSGRALPQPMPAFSPVIIGPNDPIAQRAVFEMYQKAVRRGFR